MRELQQIVDDEVKQAVDAKKEQRQDHHKDEHKNRSANGFFAGWPYDLLGFRANLIHKFRDGCLAFFVFGHRSHSPSRKIV